jgi:hypothetical protein
MRMQKKPHKLQDTAWKSVMDTFFKDFVEFCLPDLYFLIDWTKSWENLDTELRVIAKDNAIQNKQIDKLFKIFLKDDQHWILLHLEVHGDTKKEFPQNMFTYSYRLFDRHKHTVVSCAILTDGKSKWRPSYYEFGMTISKHRLDYFVIKLIDYRGQEAMLGASPNPFASVILNCLEALKVKKQPDRIRLQTKLTLTRRLQKKDYSREQIISLLLFLDLLLHLPEQLEKEYQNEINLIEETQKMGYLSNIETMGIKKGFQQGECSLLMRQLMYKFHHIPENHRQRLSAAGSGELHRWGERILVAESLNEVFED